MRGLFFSCLLLLCSLSVIGQESIRFDYNKQDLGGVKEGDVIEVVFSYENVSGKEIVITDVIPQCGCTVADFDSTVLLPHDKSDITLFFDSKNKQGLQRKTVSVLLKNGERYVLVIVANVVFAND